MEVRRCMKCMHPLTAGETVCPECGRAYGSANAETFALKPGTILEGKYLVGEMLGQGGFGITYIGFDLLLEQKVAIKEYYPMSTGMVSRDGHSTVVWSSAMMGKTGTQKGFDSFLKEARKMAKLGGIPGVVGVKSVFIQNETAYIVMDFIEGETLLKKLQKNGPMDFDSCVKLMTPIMQALAEVHEHGIIHRDISPDNIMVRPDGKLILLDLGAAKDLDIQGNDGSVQSSQMVAKHGFSPFEQYTQRGSSGPWTDVYAMAATVYYTLTGKLPPVATDRVVEDTISWEEPGLKALSAQALEALQKAMVISAKNRMQSMEELEKGLYSTAVEPAPTPAPQPVQETQPEPQPAPETKPESQPEQEVKPEPKPTPEPAPQAQSEPKPKAGEKSGKKLWIAAAAVIAVVLCGALVWANAGKPADDTNTAAFAATTPTTTPTAAATAAPTTTATVAEETSPQPMFYSLNMTPEEFEQESALLIDTAKSWTENTAPQNLSDFPFFPESLFELFDTVESAQSEIEITGSTMMWKSNLTELLPMVQIDGSTIYRTFDYVDTDTNAWKHVPFESVGDCTYSVQSSADAWIGNTDPKLYFSWLNYLEGWNEILQVSYEIPNKRVEGVPYVSLIMSNSEYSISWSRNLWDANNYAIDIYSYTTGRIWFLRYDATSGKLIQISK